MPIAPRNVLGAPGNLGAGPSGPRAEARLVRLFIAVVVSIAGTLVTAVIFKPAALLSAVILPVLAELVEQVLARPLGGFLTSRAAGDAVPPVVRRRPDVRTALRFGLAGFAIAAVTLGAVTLALGEPLRETPTIGGGAIVERPSGGGGGGDGDKDGDGVADAEDNCPDTPNTDQADFNDAGRGDACDPDDDNDEVDDTSDNCPLVPNPLQEDSDPTTEEGDACAEVVAADADGDGVADGVDNCSEVPNENQADADGDAAESGGDACDEDDDNDGTPDVGDAFPFDSSEQFDSDGDGIGDNADPA